VSAPEGLLLIDKPAGITSHDVVDRVRRAIGTRKVGHAGTLDPLATGLLLVGVGRATRLLRFLSELPKTYDGTALLGVETDTLDADGTVLRRAPVDVRRSALERVLSAKEGDSMQAPPAYSAVKVGGRTLHSAARSGEELRAAERPISVESFRLRALRGDTFDFEVTCSSGTYVRVLVAEVGSELGPGAHLTRLVRTRIGPFSVADARAPEDPGTPLPVERAVAHLPRLDLQEEEATAAGHGRVLGPAGLEGPYGVYAPGGRLIGVYRDDGAKARPELILAVPVDGAPAGH
jgi:tRNA pseudouridine55 synthase